ncbi:hypothetical protein EON63_06105 [archaeon]|nr:MAG: hypothetical protein EON63_06105 [archaeon]
MDPKKRLEKVKKKLRGEMEQNAVICLQEVSATWAGPLHSLFSESNYHFVTALYGNKFNGYMGVGVAVPREKYTVLDVDITKVADTKRMARTPKPTYFMSLILRVKSFFLSILQMLKLYEPPFDMWNNVLYRHNQMICARLQQKETGKKFVVGTYHMPCMFNYPSVMNTHCALSAQHIARYAGEDPYIYTGKT